MPEVGPTPKVGTVAPAISGKTVDGKEAKLSQYKDKKPVLVLFWASWCTPSSKALKEISKEYAEFKEAGVEVLAVSIDKDESAMKRFAGVFKIECPTVHDKDMKAAAAYGVKDIPAVFLIDKQGNVQKVHTKYPGVKALLADAKAVK